MEESRKYQEMLNEVESLVKQIAAPEMDLDTMVEKVQRGYELIEAMKARLAATKSKIDELHHKFENPNHESLGAKDNASE